MPGVIGKSDRSAAAQLLADAFFDNPAHVYIYPDDKTRRRKLVWLMRVNLNAQFDVGVSFGKRAADGSIAAMGFWHPPGAPTANLTKLAQYGFFAMPFLHGLSAFGRMLHVVDQIETRRLAALNGVESWYLNNMVVAPAARGKGLGSEVLRAELRMRVDGSGAPATLTTQKAENVNFYKGLGFSVIDDSRVEGDSGDGFDNWIMRY
ncbi:MAG: GNAT family N-acetyltransferase [Alphaproteobacteria bacterium]|nr:GNAT family N-acetyltransferase [Alphaproteobacteria bacterium]